MSYLLDRKLKRKKITNIVLVIIVLFFIGYFRVSIFNGLSYGAHVVFNPVLKLGNNISNNVSSFGSFFASKKVLLNENKNLRLELDKMNGEVSNHNSILDENIKLKEILNRIANPSDMVLSAILFKPNTSPYDTLVIDVGDNDGVKVGDRVFALGNIPIGYISNTYPSSSKVILFSSSSEKTEVVIPGHDVFMQIVGRGGGNFEMILPRDFVLEKDQEVHLPGIVPYAVALFDSGITDPRDSFVKALLVSPVNIQELKFVQVQR